MAKVLVIKEKKEYVPELKREVTVIKQRNYFVENLTRDFNTAYGTIARKDLKRKDGSKILTKDTKKEFVIFTAQFVDCYKRLRKLPQTIPLKDIGLIIGETGLNSDSVVVDAGTGSGALACALANVCKQVISYEIREEHQKVARENIAALGLTNIKLKKKDITGGIDEKNADLVTLDIPEPWNAISSAEKALKIGSWLVSYSPCITSVQDFVAALEKNSHFLLVKTTEIIERLWEASGRRVRPKSTPIGHSGFIVFARKIC